MDDQLFVSARTSRREIPRVAVSALVHGPPRSVILTTKEERELWMSGAPWEEVKHLQRPLLDGTLKIVAKGLKQDGAIEGSLL